MALVIGSPDVCNNQELVSKRDWNSLPVEIKREVIKFLPLRKRFVIMAVCRSFKDFADQLNNLQTKLVIADEQYLELSDDANSVCGRPSHTFDHSSILELFEEFDKFRAQKFARKFPNLLALRLQIHSTEIVDAFAVECRKLEHLSVLEIFADDMNEESQLKHSKLSPITCLDFLTELDDLVQLPNLKYLPQAIYHRNDFTELLTNGLIGYSLKQFDSNEHFLLKCLPAITKRAHTTEVLYDFNVVKNHYPHFMALLPQMTRLTTVYVSGGGCYNGHVRKVLDIESLRNLEWTVDGQSWNERDLRTVFDGCGHRLRRLWIGIQMHPEKTIKAVLATCRNLEELSVHQGQQQQQSSRFLPKRNSLREFKHLQQFTKLKKCDIEGREVNVSFLRRLDTNMPELNELCESGESMTVKQMLAFQHLTNKAKSLAREVDHVNKT